MINYLNQINTATITVKKNERKNGLALLFFQLPGITLFSVMIAAVSVEL